MQQNSLVYSKDVIDMVTVAVQTCLAMEHAGECEKAEFIDKMVKMLPLLYVKTLVIEHREQDSEAYLQSFVSEDDYNLVAAAIADLLGSDDTYLEVFMDDMRFSDTPITAFISENLADIYQELKDMIANFRTGNEAVMESAVMNMLDSFRQHWGQKLLNVMRALHPLYLAADNQNDYGF